MHALILVPVLYLFILLLLCEFPGKSNFHYFSFQFSAVDIDEPLFQPFPSEVTFQQFEPHEIYEVPLLLRNNDKVKEVVVL